MDIILKQGDTGIGRRATLESENGPVDLKDAAVIFLFGDHEIYPIKEAEIGRLLLFFDQMHTAQTGIFRGSFKVTFEDGRRETFPSEGILKIKIEE